MRLFAGRNLGAAAAVALVIQAASVQAALRPSGGFKDGAIRAEAPAAEAGKPQEPPSYPVSSVSGTVLDKKTRQPLPGLSVVLGNYGTEKIIPLPGQPASKNMPVAVTDAQGRYVLRFMTDSRHRLSLSVALKSAEGAENAYSGSSVSVGVYQGEAAAADAIEAALDIQLQVRGRVVDQNNQPVAGARVNHFSWEVLTDKDGYFTDTHVSQQIWWEIAAQGFAQKRYQLWLRDQPPPANPVVQLTPCKSVTGTVLDAAGKPAGDVQIYGGGFHSLNILPVWHISSDKDGHFDMGTCPEKGGAFYIFPVCGKVVIGEPVKVEPGEAHVALQIYPAGAVEVELKDAEGKPVADANLRSSSQEEAQNTSRVRWGKTDENGRALIEEVPAGSTKIELTQYKLRLKQMPSVVVKVEAGKTAKCSLACGPEAEEECLRAYGSLVDEQQRPVLHASLEMCLKTDEAPPRLHRGYGGWTQVDGRFEMKLYYDSGMRDKSRPNELQPPEKPGFIRIAAALAGYDGKLLDEERPWPKNGKELDLKQLVAKLIPERLLTVKVERPGGRPASASIASCTDEAGKSVPIRHVDKTLSAAAEHHIAVRRQGALKLLVNDEVGYSVEVAVPADAKAEVPLAAQMPPARQVEFTVLDEAGKPLEGINFYGLPANRQWPLSHKYSGKDGKLSFEVAREAEGQYVLFQNLNHRPCFGQIKAGEQPLLQTINLQGPDAAVSGQITAGTAKPPQIRASLNVRIEKILMTSFEIPVDAEGRFNLPVPSGLEVSVHASADTKDAFLAGESEEVKVAAGQKLKLDVALEPRSGMQPFHRPKKSIAPNKDDF